MWLGVRMSVVYNPWWLSSSLFILTALISSTMKAAKRQKLMAKAMKTFTNLSAPRQIINVVNGSKSTTHSTIIGPATVSQQHSPQVPPRALASLTQPLVSPEIAITEEEFQSEMLKETWTQVSNLCGPAGSITDCNCSAREATR